MPKAKPTMDGQTARGIINKACRQIPELREALDVMKAEHIEVGVYFENAALRYTQQDRAAAASQRQAVTATERREAIRRVHRPGMTGEAVRQALMDAGEVYALRTIQRDMKKMKFI